LILQDDVRFNINRINQHYGNEMAGGGCVLVDNNGKIVLVNPSVDDVKRALETNL
jgi:hypothetical protein